MMGILSKSGLHRKTIHLCDKDPKEQQCDVPGEEEEGGADPEAVEEGEVHESSYAVQGMDRAVKMKIQSFADPCLGNISQKEINNKEVPDGVKCLNGTALHH